ncbi:MAG: DUF2066 domain-containing protein [Gammaproteobacteria bacterium]
MRWVRYVLLAAGSLLALASEGVQVRGLYEAEIPNAGGEPAAKAEAMAMALRVVLVKLTGDRNAAQREGVASLFKEPQVYIQQYGYHTSTGRHGNAGDGGRVLAVKFDAKALSGALRRGGVNLWGRERPLVLVGVSLGSGEKRVVVSRDDASGYTHAIEYQARQRGLPIVIPIMDERDRAWLADLQAPPATAVSEGSNPYGADAILAGHLNEAASGLWEASWSLYYGGEVQRWLSQGDSAETVLEEGVDQGTDALVALLNAPSEQLSEDIVHLTVHGVAAFDHYAQLQHYLESLEAVTHSSVVRVQPDSVEFVVICRGGEKALSRAIALGKYLEPMNGGPAPGHYQLRLE